MEEYEFMPKIIFMHRILNITFQILMAWHSSWATPTTNTLCIFSVTQFQWFQILCHWQYFLSFIFVHMGILWLSPERAIVHVDLASKQIHVARVNGVISWIIVPTGFLQFDFSERSDISAEFLNSFIH